jgi:CheY-like chemotaxis protein
MKKVIMTEDVGALLAGEQSFLNRSSIRTFVAATNEEILALHRADKADLIIAGLTAGEMTGLTLCSVIRNDHILRSVSVILICRHMEDDLEQYTQCGANAFIMSPVNTAVLLQEAYQLLQISARRSCRIPLRLKLEGTEKNRPFTAYTENISASGMLFRSSGLLYEGDTILCTFSLDSSTRLTASAEIIRVIEGERKQDGNLYGIRFTSLSEDDLAVLEAFVEKSCVS